MLTMWFCGDTTKNIPPYKMLKACDVKHIKGGKQKISNMRRLVSHVLRAAVDLTGMSNLVVQEWNVRKVLDLYNAVKHMFQFPLLEKHDRRWDTISWKSYYNQLCKRKYVLYGEQGVDVTDRADKVIEQSHASNESNQMNLQGRERVAPRPRRKRKNKHSHCGTKRIKSNLCASNQCNQKNQQGNKRDSQRLEINSNDRFSNVFSNITMTDAMRQQQRVQQESINVEIQNEAREEQKWESQRQLDVGVSCSTQANSFKCAVPGCIMNIMKPNHKCHAEGCSKLIHNLCAQRWNLTSNDNELDMYCSLQCKQKTE